MEGILKTLNDIQPLLMLGGLVLFYLIESFIPYFRIVNRGKHTARNLAMMVFTLIVNIAFSVVFMGGIMWANERHFGFIQWLPFPLEIQIALGILAIDLGSYLLHVITHKFPLLWRYHRVHHSDTQLDSTTGFRFHPFEIAMQNLWQTGFLMLMGMPLSSAILYYTLFLPWLIMEHSNIKFPDWFERYASLLIVTPGFHKVHHSTLRSETDSHYGDFFTIWDRIFGTMSEADIEKMDFGIEQFREEDEQTVLKQLAMPFKPLPAETLQPQEA